MFKAIMAVDDKGGISRDGSMPWPKNSSDLKWFKKNTLNAIVIMGRATWEDPFMPSPLVNRLNILVTNQNKNKYPGADEYISGNIIDGVVNLKQKYNNKDFYIIGGSEILNQLFELVEEFYLTKIYGDFYCDKKIDLNMINRSMKMVKRIDNDETCHFEIWKK
ncbi:dihydrofolate reductase [Alphaproteobacteria bacterium]|nr:dihydrofolate reductase [Alphaproteobacteria bacterium]